MDIPGQIVTLNPGDWPQDSLIVPDLTGMGRLDRLNTEIVKREYFGLVGSILITQNRIIPYSIDIPQYGDFWMSSFAMFANVEEGYIFQPYTRMTMTDARSGYEFFRPYAWTTYGTGIAPAGIVGTPAITFNQPTFAGMPRSNLLTPYCFPRSSSVLFTFNSPRQTGQDAEEFTLYIILDGWLEYQNASG